MKQVLIRQGRAVVEEVPDPAVEPNTVLVRVEASAISVGTEMSGIRSSGKPLWKRALEQPARVKQVLDMAASQGIGRTLDIVKGAVQAEHPIGYSAAGRVVAVGDGITDLRPGDRVACAGAQCAHHAELIRVPRNLTVAVPEQVEMGDAATVTLGAIALQGVRRLTPTLGETFVVVGLGLLGILTVQILKAAGCRVIGMDLDAQRVAQAMDLGMDLAIAAEDGPAPEAVARLTGGMGADGVVVTASSASEQVLATAFRSCRRKGRVVLVGDVPMVIDRADIYAKELDFLISTSYGPGRYDRRYEEEGADYPVAYVRWTENRNMQAYLELAASGAVRLQPMVGARFALEQASEAYEALKGSSKPLLVLLDYPAQAAAACRRVNIGTAPAKKSGLGVAVVGGGAFAKAMHLPNLRDLGDKASLRAVVSRTGHNAKSLAKQFGAAYAATEMEEVLADSQVDALIVATRHDLHAPLVLKALEAGKHVFVEKPLALTAEELAAISDFYARNPSGPVLMTGFNRRFSPCVERMAGLIANRAGPFMATYRMNAGWLPGDHWTLGAEGGGRNRGEACHIYDLFTFLAGTPCVSTQVAAARPATGHYRSDDNFSATFTFGDGSVANLIYTALGAKDFPKERMDVFCDGKVLVLDDYKTLSVSGISAKGVDLRVADKGHAACLAAFVDAALGKRDWPIALWQQVQATEMALAVEPGLA